MLLRLLLPLLITLPGVAAEPAPAERRPIEHFASLPQLSRVTLSPDGQHLAMLLSEGGRTGVVTRKLGAGGGLRVALSTDNQKFRINWVRWVGNERLLVSVAFASRRDFVATTETRLFSVRPDGKDQVSLQRTQTWQARGQRGANQQIQDDVIDMLHGDGRHVLVQLADNGSALPGVTKLNVENGSRDLLKSPERDVLAWITDQQHRVRVGIRVDSQDGRIHVIAREPAAAGATSDWRTLWSFDEGDSEVWPLGFGADPQELYVRAVHEGRFAAFAVRLDDPTLPRRLLLARPGGDVEGQLLVTPGSGEVLGLRGVLDDTDGEAPAGLWSPTWGALMQMLGKALPGFDATLLEVNADGQRYLVYTAGNGRPGRYYLGDRASGQLTLIGETYPALDKAPLAGKKAVTIKARDGLPLRAYLTLPRGRGADAKLPLVLLSHGGPASRDDEGFDPWTEFLADRGYAVLQVNFRGSDGYGPAFREAGLKRWGLEMQDDLTDAVRWAVAQGVADPQRICIVGASYGGYAALMGAAKTPELYRCAVSFAGVAHLPDLIAHTEQYHGGRRAMQRLLGDAWDDRARLRATSPALQAERFRAPVLLVHGSMDRSVPVEQSRTMAGALKSAGKSVKYVEQDGGDHHLGRQADRLEFFRELEAFLDQHLQPPR